MIFRSSTLPRAELPEWLLVANAARARCFESGPGARALRELTAFVHPSSRLKGEDLMLDRAGLARKGAASTQFQPHTDVHEKEHTQFARELARYLEAAALEHRFGSLVLLVSNPFLGELRAHLGDATRPLLRSSVALDLTAYRGTELEQRVTQALETAG